MNNVHTESFIATFATDWLSFSEYGRSKDYLYAEGQKQRFNARKAIGIIQKNGMWGEWSEAKLLLTTDQKMLTFGNLQNDEQRLAFIDAYITSAFHHYGRKKLSPDFDLEAFVNWAQPWTVRKVLQKQKNQQDQYEHKFPAGLKPCINDLVLMYKFNAHKAKRGERIQDIASFPNLSFFAAHCAKLRAKINSRNVRNRAKQNRGADNKLHKA